MKHPLLQRVRQLAMILLLTAVLSSCIYDKYHTVQFNVYADAVGDDGNTVPDYLVDGKRVYFFVNDRYFDGLVPGENGSYNVSFPEGSVYTFVGAAAEDESAFRFNTPYDGENIHNVYAEVLDYANIPPLYWGSVSTTGGEEGIHIEMRDIRCRSHILIKNMRNRYGESNYSVVIGGLRKAISYDGEACGDMAEVHRQGAFQGAVDQWLSNELISLPTAPNEGINVRIQRGDGELIAYADIDDDGNVMALPAGGDVVFIITLNDRLGLSVKVAQWSDVYSEFNF